MATMREGAPGRDGMCIKPLRQNPLLKAATINLIQQAWQSGTVPSAWTEALLIPIPKKGATSKLNDYRGITLLSVTSKIMARIIHNRAANAPILPEQHGFRAGDSTLTPIMMTKMAMQAARKCGMAMVSVFLDITKAYDWVPRDVLYETLEQYQFSQHVIKLIKALYLDNVYVKLGSKVSSTPFQSHLGVRQGCPLSPLLFNLVMDRVLRTALPTLHGVPLEDDQGLWTLKLRAYADDIVLFSVDQDTAAADTATLTAAMAAAGLTISVDKTKYVQQELRLPQKPRPPAVLPTAIQQLPTATGTVLFLQVPEADTHIKCPIPNCDSTLTGPAPTRVHLQNIHALTVSIGSRLPRKMELTPFSRSDSEEKCPHCHKQFKNFKTATEHWRGNKCHHNTPEGALGYELLGGNNLPLPVQPPPEQTHQTRPPPLAITIYGQPIQRVETFTYLGRVLSARDDDTPAITARIAIARRSFNTLHKCFFSKKHITTKTKLAVTRAVLQAQLVYGAQTWSMSVKQEQRVRACQQHLLRHATGTHPTKTKAGHIRYPRHSHVLRRANAVDIINIIRHAQLRFAGHLLRLPTDSSARRMLTSSSPLPGRQGFVDRNLIRSNILSTMTSLNVSATSAMNRQLWRSTIAALLQTSTRATVPTALAAAVPAPTPPATAPKLPPKRTSKTRAQPPTQAPPLQLPPATNTSRRTQPPAQTLHPQPTTGTAPSRTRPRGPTKSLVPPTDKPPPPPPKPPPKRQ